VGIHFVDHSGPRDLPLEGILALYRANDWSSAQKPELLHKALVASHSLVTAWNEKILVGLGNAISNGLLVVYYPHVLVLPEYQGRGIGTRLMQTLMGHYQGFINTCSWLMGGHSTSIASAVSSAPEKRSRRGFTRATTTNKGSYQKQKDPREFS
jgi:GNAT superfamily N-acetyltransferase